MALCLCSVWLLLPSRHHELVFEGKTLNTWLDSGFEDCSRALDEIGPAAVPGIFQKLEREHPLAGSWQRYRKSWEKVPGRLRVLLPKPRTGSFDEWRACNVLTGMGPTIVPRLMDGLTNRNALIRLVSVQTLAAFWARGLQLQSSVPGLQKALDDPDPRVRTQAALAFQRARPGAAVQ